MPKTDLIDEKPEFIPAYEGEDMARYIMEVGFKLPDSDPEIVQSVTNVRNTAIIVTDYKIYRARPCHQIGFCIEVLAYV